MSTDNRCEATFLPAGEYRLSRCSRKASVDGRWCKQHAPVGESRAESWFIAHERFGAPAAVHEVKCIRTPKTLKVVRGEEHVGFARIIKLSENPLRETRGDAAQRYIEIIREERNKAIRKLARLEESLDRVWQIFLDEQESEQ